MTFADELAANRRLAILRLLVEGGGRSNDSVLEMCLRRMGHHAGLTRAYVREQLRFLESADLVTIEMVEARIMVAKLSRRGGDVVTGAVSFEGVAAPNYGD